MNQTVVSDWTNGCLLLATEDGEGKRHVVWGVSTLAFSWGPALLGIAYVMVFGGIRGKDWVLLPVRFLLWPFLVPIGM